MLLLNLNSFGRRVDAKRHNDEENACREVHPAPARPAQAGRPQLGEEVCPPENSQSLSLKSRPFGSQADDYSDLNIAMLEL